MKIDTEMAIKEAQRTAQNLGMMQASINAVKIAGAISDKDKIQILIQFCDEAEAMIDLLRSRLAKILEAENGNQ